MTTFVYALVDPFTQEIRYVGKSDKPERRFRQHLLSSPRNPHKASWIASLQRRERRPELHILEEVPVDKWEEREQFWIEDCRSKGARLLNHCDGGRGVTMTPEVRAKIGAATRGKPNKYKGKKRPVEVGEKIRAAKMGHPVSAATRSKIAAVQEGRPLSRAAIEKAAAMRRGRPLPESVRAKMSRTKTGAPASPALRAEIEKQKLRAWQAAGFSEIPDLRCGLCGCKMYVQPARIKNSASGEIFCCQAHQAQAMAKPGVPRDPVIIEKLRAGLERAQLATRQRIESRLRADPALPNRVIADLANTSRSTVARVREWLKTHPHTY